MSRSSVRPTLVAGIALLSSLLAPGAALAYDGHNAQGRACWATSGTVNGLYHASELGCVKDGSSNPQPAPTAAPALGSQPVPTAAAPAGTGPCGGVVGSSFLLYRWYDGDEWGGLAMFDDGTYEWVDSPHSPTGSVITGNWVDDTSRPCGAITLQQGYGNQDWTVQATGKRDAPIVVSDQFGVAFIAFLTDY